MLEILLNATKLATSKEFRQGASLLFEELSKTPEWQQDICTLEIKISLSEIES